MFLTELFGFFSMSALNTWGFMMAFFFNLFVFSLGNKRKTTLLLSSFCMLASYTASDYFYTWLSIYSTTYLDWVLYDFFTILSLICCYFLIRNTSPSFFYLIVGLSINMIYAGLMYIDVNLYKNNEHWFLWDAYSYSVFSIDLLMIVALIVDRDFLGLHKLKNKLFGLFKSSKLQHTI
nr:hypothetical protein [Pseudoalteromonas espejiana]